MTSLRRRTLAILSIFATITVAVAALTATSYMHEVRLRDEIQSSHQWVEKALEQYKNSLSDDQLKALFEQITSVENKSRNEALNKFFKKSNLDNLKYLINVESEYRRFIGVQAIYYAGRVRYFGSITFILSLLFCLVMSYLVLNWVLAPLKDISDKMVDFLNNKYTYQFTVPGADEIGQLHTTFNAMAQKVLKQFEELKSLDKAKSEFLSIASHELRTPLTSIKGSLSLLQSGVVGKLNDPSLNLMRIALDETDRLIRLINELLDLAKIEARQFPLKLDWINAEELGKRIFQSLQGFAQVAEVNLELSPCANLDLHVDADRFQQVVTNLLSNAIKYSPKKESVVLKFIEDENHFLRVEVSDRGKGIAPEDQELIFEKFRQATGPQNPLVKGTGLGLAIAKAIVEQHGGQIGVRSKPGEGSTFFFTLPEWRENSYLKAG